ncbi:2-(3-amino-3-carboxypropyl)histidine synthase subunit 2, partial [Tanacetum coccineum]
ELQSNDVKDIGLYVMADTTYGSCCVDEVGASHINAECVIHYGHTCLSPRPDGQDEWVITASC